MKHQRTECMKEREIMRWGPRSCGFNVVIPTRSGGEILSLFSPSGRRIYYWFALASSGKDENLRPQAGRGSGPCFDAQPTISSRSFQTGKAHDAASKEKNYNFQGKRHSWCTVPGDSQWRWLQPVIHPPKHVCPI